MITDVVGAGARLGAASAVRGREARKAAATARFWPHAAAFKVTTASLWHPLPRTHLGELLWYRSQMSCCLSERSSVSEGRLIPGSIPGLIILRISAFAGWCLLSRFRATGNSKSTPPPSLVLLPLPRPQECQERSEREDRFLKRERMSRQPSRSSSPGTALPSEATVTTASQLPSYPSASRSCQKVDEPGAFLLLNGFVCRTADASGRFRPVEVFSGVYREAATAPPTMPSANAHFSLSAGSAEETRRSIDSDCPLFNCFGVLSGGVIIDPIDGSFVEFTDAAVYTPSTVAAPVGSGNDIQDDLARCTLQQANEQAFRTGEAHLIRPECPLILCTSELPLPPRSSDPPLKRFKCCSSPFSAAGGAGPTVTSARHAAQMGMENVEKWLKRLAPHPGHRPQSPRRQAWTTVWADAEEFRLSMRAHSDVRASEASLYLPPRIPFPLRFRGQPISLMEEKTNESPTASQQQQPDREVSSATAVPPDGVRCAAASFTCYTGVPRFASATDTAPRFDLAEFAKGTAVARLRKRLRPYCETASLGRRRASDDYDEEDKERFLIPFTDSTPRHAAFALFLLYFNHLGVLCNGVRVTGETAASSCLDGLDVGSTTWSLCPKYLYDVRAEVERKRRVTRELRERPERTFAGGTRWSTTARNRDAVAAAWTALLLSSRTALLERITELNRHIHKLHDEKQRRRHADDQENQ